MVFHFFCLLLCVFVRKNVIIYVIFVRKSVNNNVDNIQKNVYNMVKGNVVL